MPIFGVLNVCGVQASFGANGWEMTLESHLVSNDNYYNHDHCHTINTRMLPKQARQCFGVSAAYLHSLTSWETSAT
jgi:hypothetical protein